RLVISLCSHVRMRKSLTLPSVTRLDHCNICYEFTFPVFEVFFKVTISLLNI
ncbi:hypothetical protein COCCADRAFT_95499, partial [Bipolaris zeicola 26-R-13]